MEDIRQKISELKKRLEKLETQLEDRDKIVCLTNAVFTSGNIYNDIEVEFLLFKKYRCAINLYDTKLISPDEIQASLIDMIKKILKN